MGFTDDSLAALAYTSRQQVLEAIHSKVAQGKAPLIFLPTSACQSGENWSFTYTTRHKCPQMHVLHPLA